MKHARTRANTVRTRVVGIAATVAATSMVVGGAAVALQRTEPAPVIDGTALASSNHAAAAFAAAPPLVFASAADTFVFEIPEITITINAPASSGGAARARSVANNPAPPSVAGNAVLEIAAKYVGYAYVSGGQSPSDGGFDCSGFVSYVYGQLGVTLPVTSGSYYSVGTRVSAADALPGDIIVSPGHVGIYAGNGLQIDAPRPGKTIQFRGIWQTNPVYVRVS